MFQGISLRAFAFVVFLLCFVLAIAVGLIGAEETEAFSGFMHPTFLIMSYGVSVAFLAIHFLVFAGKADESDISYLAMYITLYAVAAFIFAPDPARWIQFFAITIIVLGVEYIFPDWPVRIYKALSEKEAEEELAQ